MHRHYAMLVLTVVATGIVSAENYVWVEGEAAITQSATKHNWYNNVKKGNLSGGDWLSHFGGQPAVAEYHVEIPKETAYTFWVRANPVAEPLLSYQLGDADWKLIDLSRNLENTNIAADDKPDMRFVAWIKVGELQLKAGVQKVRFKMHSGNNNHGGLDCFVFTAIPFQPNGICKPGAKLGLAHPGRWSFEPDIDPYEATAVFDLRTLNEKVAGESGWVKQSPEGEFVDGRGQPIRFWCANTGVQRESDIERLKAHARHIAKRGINMVRHHGHIHPTQDQPIDRVNDDEIASAQRMVAVMKEEGIYSTFSPYWATAQAGAKWGLKGHPDGPLFGMLFWDEDLQRAYKGWIKTFLTRPNPFEKNKTPLAKDPALAIFQIQNEDSLFFWTTQQYTDPKYKGKLERLQVLYDKWRTDLGKGPGKLKIRFWELENPNQDHKDTMRFFAESMYKWNKEVERFLREEVGYGGLVNAGNWRTANQARLLDLERYSYSANAVIGCNRYVDGGSGHGSHVCPGGQDTSGYLVKAGDFFQDISVLKDPARLATNARQVAGHTYIIPESTWVPPMSYQSEGPFLVAAYSSLNGIDGYYWFALGEVGYDRTLNKWQAANPAVMGGWPAAALMFRKGYIKKGEPALHEERKLEDLWELKKPLLSEEAGFDPNRDVGNLTPAANADAALSTLTYLVGPVQAVYGGDPSKTKVADLAKYIDGGKKNVRSNTGELSWNYGVGVCTLDAPCAQGATGFLAQAGEIALSALRIVAKNDYATVLAVSLDGKPLASSARILLQITTRCRPYNWKEEDGVRYSRDKAQFTGKKVVDTGNAPWNVWNTDLTVTVKNAKLTRATQLDLNGYARTDAKVDAKAAGGELTVTPPPDGMYLVLE